MARAAVTIETALGLGAFHGDAHGLLVMVYKDETQPIEFRVDAAKAAIWFEKPSLASVKAKVRDPFRELFDEHLDALLRVCDAS